MGQPSKKKKCLWYLWLSCCELSSRCLGDSDRPARHLAESDLQPPAEHQGSVPLHPSGGCSYLGSRPGAWLSPPILPLRLRAGGWRGLSSRLPRRAATNHASLLQTRKSNDAAVGKQDPVPVGLDVHRVLWEQFQHRTARRAPTAGGEDIQGHGKGVTEPQEVERSEILRGVILNFKEIPFFPLLI